MRHSELGASGVNVSAVGLGGYWLGGDDPDAAARILEASLGAGVNWVDTSEAYFDGANERNLGQPLQAVPEMLVASKIWPARTRPDRVGVRLACEASLRRLRRDVCDVYFVHAPAPEVALEETWTAMAQLVEDGLARAVGLSNFSTDGVRQAHAVRQVDVVQDGLSLIDNLGGRAHFAACAELGVAGVVYEPLANGLLTGTYRHDSDLTEQRQWSAIFDRLFAPGKFERSLDVAQRLGALAQQWGFGLPQLAIAWCAHQKGVASVLAGTTSAAHAVGNATAGSLTLTDTQIEALNDLVERGPAFLPG